MFPAYKFFLGIICFIIRLFRLDAEPEYEEANLTRKKDISCLDYLVVPGNALPFTTTDNEEEACIQEFFLGIICFIIRLFRLDAEPEYEYNKTYK